MGLKPAVVQGNVAYRYKKSEILYIRSRYQKVIEGIVLSDKTNLWVVQ